MGLVLFVIFGFLSFASAQYSEQPLKESSHDLRTQTVLFSVDDKNESRIVILERTNNEDYFLRLKDDGKESIKKISGREAVRLDREFANKFLKCQYELPAFEGECSVTLRLTLKGEIQDLCEKEDKKTQEVVPFVSDLVKRFSP